MQDYFWIVADTFFIDCVSCVAAFGWNKHSVAIRSVITYTVLFADIELKNSQKSIDWLNFSSAALYNGKVEPLPQPSPDGVIFTTSERHISLWYPIFGGLAKTTQHRDAGIRSRYNRAGKMTLI